MEAKPLRVVPSLGPDEKFGGVKRLKTQSVNLGLGVSVTLMNSVITAAQLHELHLQTLIYKYIEAGLPVPHHLVLHIWKSLATSYGSAILHKIYPCFAGLSPHGSDCENIMDVDPEPGRCRRTDGKKWRCRRNVVLNHKYCERHVHRGRQRSRKPVEASKVALPSVTVSTCIPEKRLENSTSLSISSPVSLQLMTAPTNAYDSHSGINSCDRNKNSVSLNKDTGTVISTIPATVAATTAPAKVTYDAKDNKKFEGKHEYGNNVVARSIHISSNARNNWKIGSNASLGFGFSPRSVIQVIGCSRSFGDHKSSIQYEPGRCRRTDGKKWRCSREVLPNQKYCERHMHRGARRLSATSQSNVGPPVSALSIACGRAITMPKEEDGKHLNTKLSISTPVGGQLLSNDQDIEPSGSSSDATISDTICI